MESNSNTLGVLAYMLHIPEIMNRLRNIESSLQNRFKDESPENFGDVRVIFPKDSSMNADNVCYAIGINKQELKEIVDSGLLIPYSVERMKFRTEEVAKYITEHGRKL